MTKPLDLAALEAIAAGKKSQRDLNDYWAGWLSVVIATHDTHADAESA